MTMNRRCSLDEGFLERHHAARLVELRDGFTQRRARGKRVEESPERLHGGGWCKLNAFLTHGLKGDSGFDASNSFFKM